MQQLSEVTKAHYDIFMWFFFLFFFLKNHKLLSILSGRNLTGVKRITISHWEGMKEGIPFVCMVLGSPAILVLWGGCHTCVISVGPSRKGWVGLRVIAAIGPSVFATLQNCQTLPFGAVSEWPWLFLFTDSLYFPQQCIKSGWLAWKKFNGKWMMLPILKFSTIFSNSSKNDLHSFEVDSVAWDCKIYLSGHSLLFP